MGSIQPDRVLLLDSYFYVVVFHGTTIAAWRKAEYHLLPEQVALKQLLEARGGPAPFAGVSLRCQGNHLVADFGFPLAPASAAGSAPRTASMQLLLCSSHAGV